ncbi:Ubiquitin-protein ligase E3A [Taenia crassiceps]|uniref:HECT-type E3 ubiquitin transferase n=1 Tax=Taenia crassiceps TaxID=6207 RepID=A0ABR4QK00_9CEST
MLTHGSLLGSVLAHTDIEAPLYSKMEEANHQAVIQERTRYYFNQLTVGCGDAACTNQNCASSPNFAHRGLDDNHAAALALRLLRDSEPMCFAHSSSLADSAEHRKDSALKINSADSAYHQPDQHRDLVINSENTQMSEHLPPTSESSLCQDQEKMEGVDSDAEREGDGEVQDAFDGSTPTSSISEISPGLSRFLLHISGSSPPVSSEVPFLESVTSTTTESGDNANSSQHSYFLGLLDSIMKSSNHKPDDGEEDVDLPSAASIIGKRVKGLRLAEVRECVENCESEGNWTPVRLLLEEVFTSLTALANSFPREGKSADMELVSLPTSSSFLPQYRSASESACARRRRTGCDSNAVPPFLNAESDPAVPVDIDEAREAYKLLLERPPKTLGIEGTLAHLIRRQLIVTLRRSFRIYPFPSSGASTDPYLALLEELDPLPGGEADKLQQRMVNLFATIYACPLVTDPLHFEPILPHLCHLTVSLPMATQARLCRTWAEHAMCQRSMAPTEVRPKATTVIYWLLDLHRILMQQITLRCLALEPPPTFTTGDLDDAPAPNDDRIICDAARVIRIVFYASLLAGGCDSPEQLAREASDSADIQGEASVSLPSSSFRTERVVLRKDPLGAILGISPNDCRRPLIPLREFINETLNESIVVEKDFANFRSQRSGWPEKLSFMELPFMLQTTTKSTQLYYDNRLNMLQERRGAILHALFATSTSDAAPEMPYFKICVNRERIVEDALVALELTRMEAVGDLKKQLCVEFDGEQGIDEGGLSKEFFQLIVERIFNPDYGMFVYENESQCFWFNRSPLAEELEREYCLIGTILGLAIYNNVILDVHFPAVLFRKLCGKLASGLEDLEDGWPTLAHGLQALLDYDGDNFEDDHCLSFVVTYSDMFGQVVTHELVSHGTSKPVTIDNRQEFIDQTIDFLLNTSVKKQFTAFRRGFLSVVGDTPLFHLFSPFEIELLLLGSQHYDFSELERVTEYEGDYSAETIVIRYFWSVVHAMTEEEQRKLLQFTTGTDRIPVGGMSRMKFVIARQGPDSDRLPTAHTCFNVLLLPEYSNPDELLQHC